MAAMTVIEGVTIALQLSQAATEMITAVQKAQSMNAEQIDTELDNSLINLAKEINRQKALKADNIS